MVKLFADNVKLCVEVVSPVNEFELHFLSLFHGRATGNSRSGIPGNPPPKKFPAGIPGNY